MRAAEVIVVGGGPAGTSCAIELARAGRHVLLVDKARFPREKCCGDGLTTAALRRLEALGLDPADVASWQPVHDVVVRAPSGRVAPLPLPDRPGDGVHAVVARRADLDHALVELARVCGVEVCEGAALTAASVGPDRATATIEGLGAVDARYLVGADGMWSPLRRMLGATPAGYRGEWHAFRQYFRGVSGPGAHELAVWFEPDLLPGYAWSFPLPGGVANVGLCVIRGNRLDGGALAASWERLLRQRHVQDHLGPDAEPESARRAWPIPARIDRARLHVGRALFVGDAAAAPDLLTGEGIGQAVQTGGLAAASIVAAGPHDPAGAAHLYTAAVHRELGADHRMSALLGRALAHRRGVEVAVGAVALSPFTRGNFARWLFEDEPRAVLATPSRWHRGLLRRPGAFPGAG